MEIDMMAKIQDVFQIIRDRNLKNGSENNHYDIKKIDEHLNDTKKKSKNDAKEKSQKLKKKYDKHSRSHSPKHRRYDNRSHRDRGQKDGSRYRKDDKYNNKFVQEGKRHRSRDKEHFNKKKKSNRRSSSSSSNDRKIRKKVKNGNNFRLSSEIKD